MAVLVFAHVRTNYTPKGYIPAMAGPRDHRVGSNLGTGDPVGPAP
jgi:hypothetical protein